MKQERFVLNGNSKTTLTTYLTDSYGLVQKKPLVIICPGGGFLDCSPNEGEPVALHFLRAGYHAAVLIYSNQATAPNTSALPQALFDMAAAITLIRQRAEEWAVDSDKIVILGFSAGAQLSALYGNRWQETLLYPYGTPEQRKPNAVVLGYPLLEKEHNLPDDADGTPMDMQDVLGGSTQSLQMRKFMEASDTALYGHYPPTREEMLAASPIHHVSPHTPPTFIWQTFADKIISPLQSLHYAQALYTAGIPCELHVFDKGQHGISLADRTTAKKETGIDFHVAGWAALAVEWLDRQFDF